MKAALPLAFFLALTGSLSANPEDHAQDDAFAAELAALEPPFVTPAEQLVAPQPHECQELGEWGPVIPWGPHIPVTIAQLPDGRLLTFASNQRTTFPRGPEFTYAATWDYRTGEFVELNNPRHDMFCGGVSLLPDGRLLVNGGRRTVRLSSIFDWRTNQWTAVPDMVDRRWYNTSVALPDGEVFTASGSGGADTAEMWTEGQGWRRLAGIDWEDAHGEGGVESIWHPFLHVAPDGRIAHTGPTDSMHWVEFDGDGRFPDTGVDVPGRHFPKDGAVVMFDEGRILQAGGRTLDEESADQAQVIDIRGAVPVATPTADLEFARTFANGVVLPNGEVMVIGGNQSQKKFSDQDSILTPEIWNPITGEWRRAANMQVPRNYHSVACLLPDGTVWAGGGGLSGNAADHQDAQVYTPGCLFNEDGSPATRPEILAAPDSISPGLVFEVEATPGLRSFTFIKLSSLTHSVTSDLRFLNLPHSETSPGTYSLQAHDNLNVMTPGYWMLFAVSEEGPYSVSKTVRVAVDNVPIVANPGEQRTRSQFPVSLLVPASGPGTLFYQATGLPEGLSIEPATGLISGTLTGAPVTRQVTVTVTSSLGASAEVGFDWVVLPASSGEGTILREWWTGVPGDEVGDLTGHSDYPDQPAGSEQLASFEGPSDWGDDYGARFRGWLHPTESGLHRFWIAGNEEAQLWLSPSGDASEAVQIARTDRRTGSRQWDRDGTQESEPILLEAGQRYYIEALMKEDDGGDHVAVAWAPPGSPDPVVIPGAHLSPWRENTPPALVAVPDQDTLLDRSVTLVLTFEDPDPDSWVFAATGLPPGVEIHSRTGLITGVPSEVGEFPVTLTLSDGVNPAQVQFFDWEVHPALTLDPLGGSVTLQGSEIVFTSAFSGGLNPLFKWSFGDGSPDTVYSPANSVRKTFSAPGRYRVTVTATDASGLELTQSFYQIVHAPLSPQRPVHSSSILTDNSDEGRIWVANPDQGTVTVYDGEFWLREAEIEVGGSPRCLALGPDGRVWVTCAESSTVKILNPDYTVGAELPMPTGSRPYGIVAAPDGSAVFVVLEDLGQLWKLDPQSGAPLGTMEVGPHPRHLSMTGDSARLLLSRFITPPLPGESTGSLQTDGAGGEVLLINPVGLGILKTMVLAVGEGPDSSVSARGVPNYLGAPTISPDGTVAWVPSKQDNLQRGMLRDGNPLNHDMSVRSIASQIDLGTEQENRANRIDFDDSGMPSAVCFDATGNHAFVALESNRAVAVVDAWSGREIQRLDVGRAPQGLALSADSSVLFVHNFMDRSLSVIELNTLLAGSEEPLFVSATLDNCEDEALTPEVLLGKQLFYDAKDPRLALQEYLACAACHNDGGQDGRVWDFTGVGEGLRNTITLRGHGGADHGPLHWTGNFDEVQDFENQIRNFAGGTGLIEGTPHAPLAQPNAGRSAELDALAEYLTSLQTHGTSPHRLPGGPMTTDARAGEEVFRQQNCASCHSGTQFSNSAMNVFADIGTIRPSSGQRLGEALTGLDVPTLRGLWNTAPYLHDGSALTLQAAVEAHQGVILSPSEMSQLVAYLEQIDDDPAFAPSGFLDVPPLASLDLGIYDLVGATEFDAASQSYRVTASGRDVYFEEDGFRLAYKTLTGDGEIVARVLTQEAVNPWAKTGVMMREGLTGDARHAMVFTTPPTAGNGFGMVWRENAGGTSSYAGGGPITPPEEMWVRLVRSGDTLTGYHSSDGFSWQLVQSVNFPGLAADLQVGLAVTASDSDELGVSTLDQLTLTEVDPPSLELVSEDVGDVALAGVTGYESATDSFSLQAAGRDIFFEEDGFRYAYQALDGDGEIVARVIRHEAFNPWSKAGVMMREELNGSARHAALFTTPGGAGNGFGMVARDVTAGSSSYAGGPSLNPTPNNWLRLVRSGDLLTGFVSDDGVTWQMVSSTTLTGLAPSIFVGLALTSSDNSEFATAEFDQVSIAAAGPSGPQSPFSGVDVGVVFTPGSMEFDSASGQHTLHASGSDIFFEQDGFHFAQLQIEGDGEIVARVVSQSHSNDWAKAGVMIREGLGAGARHLTAFTTPQEAGHGFGSVWRDPEDSASGYAAGPALAAAPNNWVRVQRSGAELIASVSNDGTSWSEIARRSFVDLPDILYLGLVLSASENAQFATAVFDSIAVVGTPPVTPLASEADESGSGSEQTPLQIAVPQLGMEAPAAGGPMSLSYTRSTGTAVRFQLEGLQHLRQSPAGWVTLPSTPVVTDLGDGTERVRFEDVEAARLFTGLNQGFVRLRAELDLDGDGFSDVTNPGEVLGWHRLDMPQGDGTLSMPFAHPVWMTVPVVSHSGDRIQVFGKAIPQDGEYYLELGSGAHRGHRFELDEAASTATQWVVDRSSAMALKRNTLAALPPLQSGDRVVLRRHATLQEVFPEGMFTASNQQTSADQVLFYRDRRYESVWLANLPGGPRWVRAGDPYLEDQGTRVIPPDRGVLVRWKTFHSVRLCGAVRRLPLAMAPASGSDMCLMGNPWPMESSPYALGMTTVRGWSANADPTRATRLMRWRGDSELGETGFESSFLLGGGSGLHWVDQGDATLRDRNRETILLPGRAVFLKAPTLPTEAPLPVPWQP